MPLLLFGIFHSPIYRAATFSIRSGRTSLLLAYGPFFFSLSVNKDYRMKNLKKKCKDHPSYRCSWGGEGGFGLVWVLGAQIPLPDLNLMFMSME